MLSVKEAAEEGHLSGSEVWLFTDNQVAEGIYHRGSSQNSSLYALMLEFKQLSLDHGFILRLVHIAGTRNDITRY